MLINLHSALHAIVDRYPDDDRRRTILNQRQVATSHYIASQEITITGKILLCIDVCKVHSPTPLF